MTLQKELTIDDTLYDRFYLYHKNRTACDRFMVYQELMIEFLSIISV